VIQSLIGPQNGLKESAKKNTSASAENHIPFRLVSSSYITLATSAVPLQMGCTVHIRYVPNHGFSHGGMRTTTGTPIIVYWYVASIKNQNIKTTKYLKK
jgi:hypothetical protein